MPDRPSLLLIQVLKVHLLGHRKRIIASLADRPYEEPPQKPPRFSQLRVSWGGMERNMCVLFVLLGIKENALGILHHVTSVVEKQTIPPLLSSRPSLPLSPGQEVGTVVWAGYLLITCPPSTSEKLEMDYNKGSSLSMNRK